MRYKIYTMIVGKEEQKDNRNNFYYKAYFNLSQISSNIISDEKTAIKSIEKDLDSYIKNNESFRYSDFDIEKQEEGKVVYIILKDSYYGIYNRLYFVVDELSGMFNLDVLARSHWSDNMAPYMLRKPYLNLVVNEQNSILSNLKYKVDTTRITNY